MSQAILLKKSKFWRLSLIWRYRIARIWIRANKPQCRKHKQTTYATHFTLMGVSQCRAMLQFEEHLCLHVDILSCQMYFYNLQQQIDNFNCNWAFSRCHRWNVWLGIWLQIKPQRPNNQMCNWQKQAQPQSQQQLHSQHYHIQPTAIQNQSSAVGFAPNSKVYMNGENY